MHDYYVLIGIFFSFTLMVIIVNVSTYTPASTQVIHQKPKKSLDEIMHDLCPVRLKHARTILFC